jgi:electron transfer flavoprotein beta subunit
VKNIIVCMKQVLDPEIPLSLLKIDTDTKQAIMPKATPPVLSPFDENALETALKIKDSQPVNITVISLGKKLTRVVVKAPLAAGADRLILLEDEIFGDFDTFMTANALAAAIKTLGRVDLILCGIQAADTNAGQVGIGIANQLGIPCITYAGKVELKEDKVRVEKVTPEGYEIIEAPTPVVVTTSYEVGALREPGVEAFMSAGKKPVTVLNAQALGITPVNTGRTDFVKMSRITHDSKCEMIDGSTPEEKAGKLVTKLQEIKVI